MNNLELVDKYIDNQLTEAQAEQLGKELQQDTDLQNLLDSVIIARKAIRTVALKNKVKELHEKYIDEIRTDQKQDNIIAMPDSRIYFWVLRIAASISFVLFGYGAYQYVALNSADIYNDKFISYKLPTNRGTDERLSSLNLEYLSGNYVAVIQTFNALKNRLPSDYFLVGIAHLQQKEYQQAINMFLIIKQYNRKHTQTYFDQETDYYLALAYLSAGKIDEASVLFKAIYGTPRHLFSESISKFDLIKLDVLRLKM